MADPIESLSLSQQERIAAEEIAKQSSETVGLLADLVDKVKDSATLGQIQKLVPWLGHTVDVAGEALPPIKAIAKLLEKTTAIDDPLDLGMIACTAILLSVWLPSIRKLRDRTFRERG